MEVQLKVGTDYLFAESLTKSNMASYYQTRGIIWDHDLFVSSWKDLDNYEVYLEQVRVGMVRLSYSDDTTFLRDLQISPEYQGKGVGAMCLELVIAQSIERKSIKLILRVFSENPAINLYESKGFVRTSEVNGLVEMELSLRSNIKTK